MDSQWLARFRYDRHISTSGFVADMVLTVRTPLRSSEMLTASRRRDSDHAECEGVSIRLRSLGFAPLSALQLTNVYFGIFLKNYCRDSFQIFTVLRKSDEGIFRGEGGKKIFRPPISPSRGDMGPPNFYTR